VMSLSSRYFVLLSSYSIYTTLSHATLFRSADVLGVLDQLPRHLHPEALGLELALRRLARLRTARFARRRLGAAPVDPRRRQQLRSEEHTSELQSRENLVCRLLLEKNNE